MNEPDAIALLAEILDFQRVIAKRQRTIAITNILLLLLGVVFCAAFLIEIFVVVSVFLRQ